MWKRVILLITVSAISLVVIVNLPVIAYTNCQGTQFESYLTYLHPICDGFVTLDSTQPDLQLGSTASGNMNATSKLTLPINNGSCQTFIQAISLSGTNLTSPISGWSATPDSNGLIDLYSSNSYNTISACSTTYLSFYPVSSGSSQQIAVGETMNYLVVFANGDSISGSVIAQ